MLGLGPHQREPVVLEPRTAIGEAFGRDLSAVAQSAGAGDLGADIGGARTHRRGDRAQHSADMHDILGRSGLNQPEYRGAAGE
ncbi:hypothetical protein LRS12_03630 [Sphingomonas sp. J344]|uniref:hypothetical protein n=1 Tax=Sphingomonas sp. J344 TaxID=2898434 RepID=UPI0021511D2C|nr:hypothetical protein [Sphingomonas sp. J344]MCR5869919.1 hypothetical protein [Sphingomonas sp. J344]